MSGLKELQVLDVCHSPGLTDVSELAALTNLRWVALSFCENVKNPQAVSRLKQLRILEVYKSGSLPDLSVLTQCGDIQSLELHFDDQRWSHGGFPGHPEIPVDERNSRSFVLWASQDATDFSAVAALKSLRSLSVGGHRGKFDLSLVATLPALQSLALFARDDIANLPLLRTWRVSVHSALPGAEVSRIRPDCRVRSRSNRFACPVVRTCPTCPRCRQWQTCVL